MGAITYPVKIVYIEWIDAHCNTGWFTNQEAENWSEGDWFCNDVGFLLSETKRHIVLAQRHEPGGHSNGEEQWGGLHRIPKAWIKNRRVLAYIKADGSFAHKAGRAGRSQ